MSKKNYQRRSQPPVAAHPDPWDIAEAMGLSRKSKLNSKQQEQADIKALDFIKKVSGTKAKKSVTTMQDWEDRSNVEEELLGLMLHFKVVNRETPEGDMWGTEVPAVPGGVVSLSDVHGNPFPYINNPEYFRPRRHRRPAGKRTSGYNEGWHRQNYGADKKSRFN